MNKIFRLLRYDWPLHFVLLITNWLPDNVFFIRLRGRLAAPFFKNCGNNFGIGRNVVFYDPSKIEIGTNVYIAYGCWLSAGLGITIDDEVLLGPYNVISTSNYTRKNGSFRFGTSSGGKVTIGRGTWIGAHCSILANVQIGNGSLIAANTVVLKNIPGDVVFAGNPGQIKKTLHD